MLAVAKRKSIGEDISYIEADLSKPVLEFADKFDFVNATFLLCYCTTSEMLKNMLDGVY